jgi:hypothetical protein
MNKPTYELIEADGKIFFSEMVKKTDSEGKVFWIPTDPANSDYAKYLASLEATEPEAE